MILGNRVPELVKFVDWLAATTAIDPYDYADWIRDNLGRLNEAVAVARLTEDLPVDETGAYVRTMYKREAGQ